MTHLNCDLKTQQELTTLSIRQENGWGGEGKRREKWSGLARNEIEMVEGTKPWLILEAIQRVSILSSPCWEIIGNFWAGRWLGQICMFMKSFWQPEYYNRLLAVFLFCSYLPTIQFQHSSQFHLVKNIIQITTPAQNLQRLPISEK